MIRHPVVEVERDVARLEISARDGEMRQAHLDSSRQIELTPLSRLISSRKIELTLCLVSSRLANLRCLISSRFTRQKRDQNLTLKLSRLARFYVKLLVCT